MVHLLGAEKLIFLIRDIDDATMTAASVESCRFVVLRSPWGRFWVGRGRVQSPTPHARALPSTDTSAKMHLKPDVSSTKCQRFRSRAFWGAPSTSACGVGDYPTSDLSQRASARRSTSEKSKQFGPRRRPVPVKNVNYSRAPRNRNSGLVGLRTTPPIVNYNYMTSTPREGYFGPTTLGT